MSPRLLVAVPVDFLVGVAVALAGLACLSPDFAHAISCLAFIPGLSTIAFGRQLALPCHFQNDLFRHRVECRDSLADASLELIGEPLWIARDEFDPVARPARSWTIV